MRKATDEQIKAVLEQNPDELDQASGGCVFYYTGAAIRGGTRKDGNGVTHVYCWFRCKDCGREWFEKDRNNIEPSVFFREFDGMNV